MPMFFTSIEALLFGIPAILIAITFHEYAHGKMADILGDPTPRSQGRLTFNPIPHLDVIGSLMLLIVGFGWAKPVLVNPFHFNMNRERGMMIVALAGPGINLLIAFFAGLGLVFFGSIAIPGTGETLGLFFWYLLWFNVMLAVFNMLPLPPLDGSKVLMGILPKSTFPIFNMLETYGPFILLGLLIFGFLGGIIRPAIMFIIEFILNFAFFIAFFVTF